ncbi:MAG: 3'-5' exonuclease domain-containing protein 2 [Paludibacteraceae bacterium]|nr:3'-5' exonuclease domain-containing protein 2 [Paludibacteraceae bacterium]
MYSAHIDKETINKLPLDEFKGEVVIVNAIEHVPNAVDYLSRQTVVGVDTESRPSFVRGVHYPTALVQIATTQRCYLFQINRIGMPEELAGFFANPEIMKIGLAFNDDLHGLQRQHEFTPQNCHDIQKIVNDYGIFELGLQKIYAIVFGRKISKNQQLTNWDTATLTTEQARYASTDAWATLRIWLELRKATPLSKRKVTQMKAAEKEAMIRHQQETMAKKQAENDNHLSQEK